MIKGFIDMSDDWDNHVDEVSQLDISRVPIASPLSLAVVQVMFRRTVDGRALICIVGGLS